MKRVMMIVILAVVLIVALSAPGLPPGCKRLETGQVVCKGISITPIPLMPQPTRLPWCYYASNGQVVCKHAQQPTATPWFAWPVEK